MGNHYCACHDEKQLMIQDNSKELSLKGRLIQLCERYAMRAVDDKLIRNTPPFEEYMQFVQHELPYVIVNFREAFAFNHSKSLETESINQASLPSCVDPLSPHQRIINDISRGNHRLFMMILTKHVYFFEQLFKKQRLQNCESIETCDKRTMNESDSTFGATTHIISFPVESPKQSNEAVNSLISTPAKTPTNSKFKELRDLVQQAPIETIRVMVRGLKLLFAMLRCYVTYKYDSVLRQLYPKKKSQLQEYNALLQEVIQKFIMNNRYMINWVITPLLDRYYQAQTLIPPRGETPELEESLMPTVYDKSIYEFSREYPMSPTRSVFKMSQIEGYNGEGDVLNDQLLQSIEKGDEYFSHIPYNQTFFTLIKMIQDHRFIKKCKFIEEFNQLIYTIFLCKRAEEDKDKLEDAIFAEDNRLSIQIYVLYKFFKSHPKLRMKQDLKNHIDFMSDNDEVLHRQVKSVLQPNFLRFNLVLEMLEGIL